MKIAPLITIAICLVGIVGGIIGLELNGVPDWAINLIVGAGIIGAIIATKESTD